MIFFDLLKSRIGFSRIGRLPLLKSEKKYISTPNITIPINKVLLEIFDFIKEFETHLLYIIPSEKYLKKSFIKAKYENSAFFFKYNGKIEQFEEILSGNLEIIRTNNLTPIIPFNIPTTVINKEFAEKIIIEHLRKVEKILKNNPNIIFGLSIKLFEYFELINPYIKLINTNENVQIISFDDLFDNLGNFRNILKIINRIKYDLDNNLVLMASGKIIPKLFPMLIYLGIDIIDSSYILYLSSESFYDTIEYLLPIYKIKKFPCNCIACRGKLKTLAQEKHSAEKINYLLMHNLLTAKSYMNKIIQYLNYEDYRAFVEKSSLDDTFLISMLRVLDKEYFDIIRTYTPINQKNKKINCIGASSYYRPDFYEFRERLVKNFNPEHCTTLVILLPCSAKKPYSESKSHRKFLTILRSFPEFPSFQEIIITSPLGAIPRQLEYVYPVNSYDIPVTGDWEEEELQISSQMLLRILKKYDKNIPIICHLDDGYRTIINKILKHIEQKVFFSEIDDSITSRRSLISLKELIQTHLRDYKTQIESEKPITKTWERKFSKILDYQFGIGTGAQLISNNLLIKKKKFGSKMSIIDKYTNESLGDFDISSGQIHLTMKGANRLTPFTLSSNMIVFDGDKILGSTLFRPGVLEYSDNLVPGCFSFILDKSKRHIIGLGHQIIGSNHIRNSKTGRVAKIDRIK